MYNIKKKKKQHLSKKRFVCFLCVTLDFVRGLGLNGALLCQLIRAWIFYMTYKVDKERSKTPTNENSWALKFFSSFGNERYLLKVKFA